MSETQDKQAQDADARVRATRLRRRLSVAVCVIVCLGFVLAIICDSRASALPVTVATVDANFTHGNAAHARLPCLLCHRRESNSARPARPGHTPCSGCHAQEFATKNGPICAICHTDVASEKPPVKPFPALKSFNMRFDHARHKGVDCSRCHKPASRGVALSIPAGFNAHATCYQCHAPRAQSAGRDISSCGTCHQQGKYTRTPVFAKAYRVNFSHAKHGSGQKLSCADCHNIRGGARQVTSPAPVQHFGSNRSQACQTCHNNQRAFGGDDFSDCKRCHQGATFRF